MLHLSGYDHVEDEERIQREDMQREILERRVTGDEKTGQSIYYQYWDHDGGSSAFRLWKEGRGSGCDNGGVGGDAGREKTIVLETEPTTEAETEPQGPEERKEVDGKIRVT